MPDLRPTQSRLALRVVAALALLATSTVACDDASKSDEPAESAITDAEVEAACANLEKILGADNPEKAKREAEACPASIRKTPTKQAKAFAKCLAEAPDEDTFIHDCMPLRK